MVAEWENINYSVVVINTSGSGMPPDAPGEQGSVTSVFFQRPASCPWHIAELSESQKYPQLLMQKVQPSSPCWSRHGRDAEQLPCWEFLICSSDPTSLVTSLVDSSPWQGREVRGVWQLRLAGTNLLIQIIVLQKEPLLPVLSFNPLLTREQNTKQHF